MSELEKQAGREKARRFWKVSLELEIQRSAIAQLRKKHWSYRAVSAWMGERGVKVSAATVQRFCVRNNIN